MRAAMAVLATRRRCAGSASNTVRAVRVSVLRVGMAIGTANFCGRRFVGQTLYVLVAIDTTEHPPVDRALHLLLVHIEAHLFTVHLFGERCIGVAGEAVRVFEFLRRAVLRGPNQQQKS